MATIEIVPLDMKIHSCFEMLAGGDFQMLFP